MIERRRDRRQLIAHGNEIDHVMVFVEWSFDLDSNAVVVPVQRLANVSSERDEVRRGEDVRFFFESNAELLGHGELGQEG